MEPMLEGLKVIELAEWAFVPSAGAVLADWGADVIKVEHPTRGDALRGLMLPGGADDFHHMMELLHTYIYPLDRSHPLPYIQDLLRTYKFHLYTFHQ